MLTLRAAFWVTLNTVLLLVHPRATTQNDINFTLAQAFPQLVGISKNPATGLGLSLGGQNLDHCCSWAVHESLDIENGVVTGLRSPSFIGSDLTYFKNQQFPCGAEYQGILPLFLIYFE